MSGRPDPDLQRGVAELAGNPWPKNYQRFGNEWFAEMMNIRKVDVVTMYRKACMELVKSRRIDEVLCK